MKRLTWLIAALAFFVPAAVYGQSSLLQGGAWTPGHAPMYVGQGGSQPIVQDSGPAGGGPIGIGLAEQLLTVRSPTNTYPAANAGTGQFGTNWCDYDAPINNATGYHFFCISPNASAGGVTGGQLIYGYGGGATPLPFSLTINGTGFTPGGGVAGIVVGSTIISGATSGCVAYNLSGFFACSNVLPSGLSVPSIALTGTPTAPTATAGTSTTQIATTAFVTTAFGAISGDCTSTSLGVITCTKTSGTPFGTMATQNANNVAITGGTATGFPSPVNPSDVAIKSYVDATALGLNILVPSALATATVLPNTPTYANGTLGVGATLTSSTNSTLTVDGTVATINTVVLVLNQASAFQNGIYTVTTAGSGAAQWVLTRATYFDQAAEMKAGSYTLVTGGSVNINTGWTLQAAVATVGTSAVTFVQFSSGATVSNVATGAGLTGGPISSTGTIAIDYGATNAWTGPNSWSNTSTFTGTMQSQGPAYFGGAPWFDVLSTAHSCAAADPTGVSDSTTAIQCHINYMYTTYVAGPVYLPCGTYLISGGTTGLLVKGGVSLHGAGMGCVNLQVATDSNVATFDASTCIRGAGLYDMFVLGYQNVGATKGTVIVGANCNPILRDDYIWFGANGISTAGVDGVFENVFVCGYTNAVLSNGANWYVRDKLDTCGISSANAFLQGTAGYVAENHFTDSDFSGSYTHSVNINDASGTSAITVFTGSVFSSPILEQNAVWTAFIGSEIGSTSFAINNAVTLSSGYALSLTAVVGSGTLKCSATFNVTNSGC